MVERDLKFVRVSLSRRCEVVECEDLDIAVPADATVEELTAFVKESLDEEPWCYKAYVDEALDDGELRLDRIAESSDAGILDLVVVRDENGNLQALDDQEA